MKALILAIALIAFTFVSCDNLQAPTASQNSSMSKAAVEKDIPVDFGCGELCPGCCVCLTGTAHLVMNGKTAHITIKVDGYGIECATGEPNGQKYNGSISQHINDLSDGTPQNISYSINGSNGGCHYMIHATVNANGEITNLHATCE